MFDKKAAAKRLEQKLVASCPFERKDGDTLHIDVQVFSKTCFKIEGLLTTGDKSKQIHFSLWMKDKNTKEWLIEKFIRDLDAEGKGEGEQCS